MRNHPGLGSPVSTVLVLAPLLLLLSLSMAACGQTGGGAGSLVRLTADERAAYETVRDDLPLDKRAFAMDIRACQIMARGKIRAGIDAWNRSVPVHNKAARRWNKLVKRLPIDETELATGVSVHGNVVRLWKDYVALSRALSSWGIDVDLRVHPPELFGVSLSTPETIAKDVAKLIPTGKKKMKRLFAAVEADLQEIETNHLSQ
jgi:hypothetical protein